MWRTGWGKCIYSSTSGIQVFENSLFRWLKFNSNALQSLINKYSPSHPGLHYIKPLILFTRLIPGGCCMLGLGGGGVAHALKNSQLTVVEYSREVIEIAQRFFMINRLTNMTILSEDAGHFVHHSKQQFQHLLVDLFNADQFPSHCNTQAFFNQCRRLLLPNGILAVNLANFNEQLPIFSLIRNCFANSTLIIPVKKSANLIVFAVNADNPDQLVLNIKKHKGLKRLFWDSQWGNVAMCY